MKPTQSFFTAVLGLGLGLAPGCDRAAAPPPAALSVTEAPAALQGAFARSDQKARAEAEQLSQAIAGNNFNEAFTKVTVLSGSPDLTPEQRQVIARSQLTVMQRLREAAAAGDQQAQALLEMHRASK